MQPSSLGPGSGSGSPLGASSAPGGIGPVAVPPSDGSTTQQVDVEGVTFDPSPGSGAPHPSSDGGGGARPHGLSQSAAVVRLAMVLQFIYSSLALVLGLASIVGGVILGWNGIAGSTSLTAKLLGLETNLNDAPPGVVLFVVGFLMIYITRFDVKLKKLIG